MIFRGLLTLSIFPLSLTQRLSRQEQKLYSTYVAAEPILSNGRFDTVRRALRRANPLSLNLGRFQFPLAEAAPRHGKTPIKIGPV